MEFPRASGILLHPTSLPGRYGIGDLGEYAYRFVDYLKSAGQRYWQVLPLGPTSYGDSPYQSLSTFAGNTNLISFDQLLALGWLTPADLMDLPQFPIYKVDYGWVIDYHTKKLAVAYERFKAANKADEQQAFAAWCAQQADWLDNFSLFVALKNENGGKAWVEWANKAESLREPAAIAAAQKRLATEIELTRFTQWVFFTQWDALHKYATEQGIMIIGDIPIFVAHDSSDVWSARELFYLDENGHTTVVAGVPPDYFSPTGQYWGNPLYRWDVMKADNYRWWVARLKAVLKMADIVRVDHFRAFYDYWEVPYNEERTAVDGQWIDGPGVPFFDSIKAQMGDLPIIAEDLGDLSDGVYELRDELGLPGMKIIQFGFSDSANIFLPHNYESNNFIVYTGTHDNNTALGWWMGEGSDGEKDLFRQLMGRDITEPHWDMIRLGMSSSAHTFIAPLQDVFGFGTDTRMNLPGRVGGYWAWRFTEDWLYNDAPKSRFMYYTRLYNRWPKAEQD